MKILLSAIILFTSFNSLQAATSLEEDSYRLIINQQIRSGLNPRLGNSVYLSANLVSVNLTKLNHIGAYLAELQFIERACSVRECLTMRETNLSTYAAILVAETLSNGNIILSTANSPYKYENENTNIDISLILSGSSQAELVMILNKNDKATVLIEGRGRLTNN